MKLRTYKNSTSEEARMHLHRLMNQLLLSLFMFCFHFHYHLLANDSLEAFFTRMEFQKLEGTAIQTLWVESAMKCCWKCQRVPKCVALNIAAQPNQQGLYECVLLKNETSDAAPPLTTASPIHHHYTLLLMPSSYPTHWYKINTSPVCFGAKDSAFGRFFFEQNMTISAIKLVHLSGYVTCNSGQESARSNWGCGPYISASNVSFPDRLSTVITDHQDKIVLPQDEYIRSFLNLRYEIPGGITSKSPELVFPNLTSPVIVTAVQEYRIWYGQDLVNRSESGNEGNACVEVFVNGNLL